MAYSIIRTEKIKTRAQVTEAIRHNFRIGAQKYRQNIEKDKTHLNEILINNLNANPQKSGDFLSKLNDYYKKLEVKERADSVMMMEFVATASPEFFLTCSEKEKRDWIETQVEFMKKEYGSQLQLAVLHLDESSPHIHFMISTEIKSVKKYKNQFGTFEKTTTSLNAKRYNPEFLVDFQTRFALANEKFNLVRGEFNSRAKHINAKKYAQIIQEQSEKLEKELIDLKIIKEDFSEQLEILKEHNHTNYKDRYIDLVDKLIQIIKMFSLRTLTDQEKERVTKILEPVIRERKVEKKVKEIEHDVKLNKKMTL